jgi:hypothetical protein
MAQQTTRKVRGNPDKIKGQGFHTNPERINKEGRPKGARSLSTILREMLEEKIPVMMDGKKVNVEFRDVLVRNLIKKASDGDLPAIREIFDRIEGSAKETIEQTTELKITIVDDSSH